MGLSDVEKMEARKAAIRALADSGLDIPGQISFTSGNGYIRIVVKKLTGFRSWGSAKNSSNITSPRQAERAMLDVVNRLWK